MYSNNDLFHLQSKRNKVIYEKEYLENVADSNCWNRNGHIRFIWSNFESDLMLENIEALAGGEDSTTVFCYGEGSLHCPDGTKVEFVEYLR